MERSIIGRIIKNRRMELNISQRELASRIQCDVKTISEIEKGIRRKPKVETLFKLSKELFIDLDDLLEYAGYHDRNNIKDVSVKKIKNDEHKVFFTEFSVTIEGNYVSSGLTKEDVELEFVNGISSLFEDLREKDGRFDELLDKTSVYVETLSHEVDEEELD